MDKPKQRDVQSIQFCCQWRSKSNLCFDTSTFILIPISLASVISPNFYIEPVVNVTLCVLVMLRKNYVDIFPFFNETLMSYYNINKVKNLNYPSSLILTIIHLH